MGLAAPFTPSCQAASCDGWDMHPALLLTPQREQHPTAGKERWGSHHTAKDTARSTLGVFYVVRLYTSSLTFICGWRLPSCHSKESGRHPGTVLHVPEGLLRPHTVCRAQSITVVQRRSAP